MHCVTFIRLKKYSIAEYSCKIISQVLVWANVSRRGRKPLKHYRYVRNSPLLCLTCERDSSDKKKDRLSFCGKHLQWSRTYRFFGISTDMGSVLPKYRNITIFLRFHSIHGNSPDFSTDFTLLSWQPFSFMFNVTGKPSIVWT